MGFKNRDPIRAEVHIRRSERLRNAMLLLADDLEAYDAAVALLAVHCAISLNDAIQVGLLGEGLDMRVTRKPCQTLSGYAGPTASIP